MLSCKDQNNEKESGITSTAIDNVKDLHEAFKEAKAGDVIVMKDGVWKDAQIKFYANGTENNPVHLRPETPGGVTLEGESLLKLGGEHIKVSGLHFKNGYSPEKYVIRFKVDDKKIAYHATVTDIVIEGYTQPNRKKKDHWVEFWGQHNTLSNSYLTGKSNKGPTVRAFLKGNESINTYHQIVNNHFGPKPRIGGPQGETMQLGDSYTSMTPAYINVEGNYFERCNGEVEIISSKSNYNTFRKNVFFESEGSLVMRHGNYATIDSNVFIGNDNSEFIGGIRVINTGHWITNNYFYKIKGKSFRSALAVMNGIPKSPQNRYNQVTDVVVANNSFINCVSPWQFSVGTNISQAEVLPPSEIRSARPERMIMANNLVYTDNAFAKVIYNYDKVDGVEFFNNIINVENKSEVNPEGLVTKAFELSESNGVFYAPTTDLGDTYSGFGFDRIDKDIFGVTRSDDNTSIGAIISMAEENGISLNKEDYGTSWFDTDVKVPAGSKVAVANATELAEKLAAAKAGDVIELAAGTYDIDKTLEINKALTITSADAQNVAQINFTSKENVFALLPLSYLKLENVSIKGTKEQDAFATLDTLMIQPYNLSVVNSTVENFRSVLQTSKASFADTIAFKNSTIINNINGIQLNKETNDKGDYNAEFVYLIDNTFKKVDANVLDYYRGGYDESTIGGNLVVKGNTFERSGGQEASKILLKTRGIVQVELENNTFKDNPVRTIAVLWGEKGQKPVNNEITGYGEIKVVQNLKLKLVY